VTNIPWTEKPIPSNGAVVWDCGLLRVWCRLSPNEIRAAHHHRAPDTPAPETPPDESAWSRWALTRSYSSVRFIPLFPDRPIVVKPRLPFFVPIQSEARIFVHCPLWVRIELSEGTHHLIVTEIPTVILSNTWFGAYTEGDLCYWLSTGARREVEADPSRPHYAVCPIQILNRSREELRVEKICLHVTGLSLFDLDGQLWSDHTTVTYHGSRVGTHVEVSGRAPAEAAKAKLVTPPRHAAPSGLAARTFASLRTLSGLGFLVD
jgi:hypothetical protein